MAGRTKAVQLELVKVFQEYPEPSGKQPPPVQTKERSFRTMRSLNNYAFFHKGLVWKSEHGSLFGGHFNDPGDERIWYEIR